MLRHQSFIFIYKEKGEATPKRMFLSKASGILPKPKLCRQSKIETKAVSIQTLPSVQSTRLNFSCPYSILFSYNY